MSGFIQNQLHDAAGAFFGSDYLRDYTHASNVFRTNTYENAPKLKFNFHVYFEINSEINVPTDANFKIGKRRVGKECLRLCRSRWSPYH